MRINYVKTIGFRKFKGSFETDLYDITNITGKNRSGKSNILYAIVNTIFLYNLMIMLVFDFLIPLHMGGENHLTLDIE